MQLDAQSFVYPVKEEKHQKMLKIISFINLQEKLERND